MRWQARDYQEVIKMRFPKPPVGDLGQVDSKPNGSKVNKHAQNQGMEDRNGKRKTVHGLADTWQKQS